MAFPLILLPILIPLFAGMILLLVNRFKPDFGYFWISSVMTALAVWGGLLALRWFTPHFFSINLWQEIGFQVEFPYFLLDVYSWPFAFSLSSLLSAVILTAPVRLNRGSGPTSWAYALILAGLSFIGILAANPLTLILAWTMMDLLEMAYQLHRGRRNEASRRAVISFSIGIAGTFLAVWAMLESQSQGLPLSYDSMTPESSQFLVLASGVRLAVFPILATYRLESSGSIGLGSLMKFASPAVSLALIARLPISSVSPEISTALLTMVLIACLYGAARWMASRDETSGRPYWILSFSALAAACLLQGRPDISPVWGAAMILGGGLSSLFTVRQVRLLFIPLITFICLTGIIFTPTGAGWIGIWKEPFQLSNGVFLVSYSLLLAGYLKHIFRQDEDREELDRWVQILYPTGLINLATTFILIGFWNFDQYGGMSPWLAPTVSTALALFWLGIRSWLSRERPFQSLINSIGKKVGSIVVKIIDLEWLFKIFETIFQLVRQFVFWLTGILEGDGGVLWAILILLLLITVIRPQVLP